MANNKFISGTMTTVDVTGNNVIFFPETRSGNVTYPNLSTVENVTVNIENRLNNCCTHWRDGQKDGSVYLSTAGNHFSDTGYSSIAGGYIAYAPGNNSIALGPNAQALSSETIAIGKDARTSAVGCSAIGPSVNVSASRSLGFGENISIPSVTTTAMGSNISVNNGSSTSIILGYNVSNVKSTGSMIVAQNCANLSFSNSIAMVHSSKTADMDNTLANVVSASLFGINLKTSSRSAMFGITSSMDGRGSVFGQNVHLKQNGNYDSISSCSEIGVGERISVTRGAGSVSVGTGISATDSILSSVYGTDISVTKANNSAIHGSKVSVNNTSDSIIMGYNLSASTVFSNNVSVRDSLVSGQSSSIMTAVSVIYAKDSKINVANSCIVGKNISVQNVAGDAVIFGNNIAIASNDVGSNSIALGSDIRVGTNSVSIGRYTSTENHGSVAVGYSAVANKADASALGASARAYGVYSTSVGYNSTASSDYSTSVGYSSLAQGANSIAIGGGKALKTHSIAIGEGALSNGNYTMAIAGSIQSGAALLAGTGSILIGQNDSVDADRSLVAVKDSTILKVNNTTASAMIMAGDKISFKGDTNLGSECCPKSSIVLGTNISTSLQHSITLGTNVSSHTTNSLTSRLHGASIVIGNDISTTTAMSEVIGTNATVNAIRSFVIVNNTTVGTNSTASVVDALVIANNSINSLNQGIVITSLVNNAQRSLGVNANISNSKDVIVLNGRSSSSNNVISMGSNIINSNGVISIGTSGFTNCSGVLGLGSSITIESVNEQKFTGAVSIGNNIGVMQNGTGLITIGENIYSTCWGYSGDQTTSSIIMGNNVAIDGSMRYSILMANNAASANIRTSTLATAYNMSHSISILDGFNRTRGYDYLVQYMNDSIGIMTGHNASIRNIKQSSILTLNSEYVPTTYTYYYNSSSNKVEYSTTDTNHVAIETGLSGMNGMYSSCIKGTKLSMNAPIIESLVCGSNITINGYADITGWLSAANNNISKLKANTSLSYQYSGYGTTDSVILGSDIKLGMASGSIILGSNSTYTRVNSSVLLGGMQAYTGIIESTVSTGNNISLTGATKNALIIGKNIRVTNSTTNKDIAVSALGSNLTISLSSATTVQNSITVVGQNSPTTLSSYEHTFAIADNGWVFTASNNSIRGKTYTTIGADYAEYMEWSDGNPDNEDRCGRFVVLDKETNSDNVLMKLSEGKNDEYILGIVSGDPSFIGNGDMYWNKKYMTDNFGRIQYEYNEDGTKTPLINPNYDPEQNYILRSERPEWDVIGLRGFVNTIDDGTCKIGSYVKPSMNGIATISQEKTNYMCVSRITNNIIKVDIR